MLNFKGTWYRNNNSYIIYILYSYTMHKKVMIMVGGFVQSRGSKRGNQHLNKIRLETKG